MVGDRKRVGEDVFGVLRTRRADDESVCCVDLSERPGDPGAADAGAFSQRATASRTGWRCSAGDWRVHYLVWQATRNMSWRRSAAKAAGGIVAFEVEGGREAAWRVVDATRMLSITANLGDAKTTITHPATTTHGRLSDRAREAAGITEGLLRVARSGWRTSKGHPGRPRARTASRIKPVYRVERLSK